MPSEVVRNHTKMESGKLRICNQILVIIPGAVAWMDISRLHSRATKAKTTIIYALQLKTIQTPCSC
jgi:hypothetical protein